MCGDRRVVRHPRPLVEQLHPAAHRLDPPTYPDRLHQLKDEPGNTVGVTCRVSVLDGGLGHIVVFEPGGRPRMQLAKNFRVIASELGLEQLAQEVVVAVSLAPAIERDHQ